MKVTNSKVTSARIGGGTSSSEVVGLKRPNNDGKNDFIGI